MADVRYSAGEVASATRRGLEEVFGEGSQTADLLTRKALGHLGLGESNVEPTDGDEAYSFYDPPRYAERVLATNSAEEIAALATEAAIRLKRSISDYLDSGKYRKDGEISMRPWIFAEGSTSGDPDGLIGELFINIKPYDPAYKYRSLYQETVSLSLRGGEEAPFDRFDEVQDKASQYEQRLIVEYGTVKDPLTNADVPVGRVNVWAGYKAKGDNGIMLHQEKGENGLLTDTLKANIFWALDTAITYYESAYHCGWNVTGLTYADYRDAGCLDETGRFDWEKAEAWVLSHRTEDEEQAGKIPELGDFDKNRLVMDSEYRAKIMSYRSQMRT